MRDGVLELVLVLPSPRRPVELHQQVERVVDGVEPDRVARAAPGGSRTRPAGRSRRPAEDGVGGVGQASAGGTAPGRVDGPPAPRTVGEAKLPTVGPIGSPHATPPGRNAWSGRDRPAPRSWGGLRTRPRQTSRITIGSPGGTCRASCEGYRPIAGGLRGIVAAVGASRTRGRTSPLRRRRSGLVRRDGSHRPRASARVAAARGRGRLPRDAARRRAPGRPSGWDEAVYVSQVTPGMEAMFMAAWRARGITLLIAPVTLLGGSWTPSTST